MQCSCAKVDFDILQVVVLFELAHSIQVEIKSVTSIYVWNILHLPMAVSSVAEPLGGSSTSLCMPVAVDYSVVKDSCLSHVEAVTQR